MPQKNFDDVAILLRDSDSVGVLKRPVKPGDLILYRSLVLRIVQNIGTGHKIALAEIADGAPVRKYGQLIGLVAATPYRASTCTLTIS